MSDIDEESESSESERDDEYPDCSKPTLTNPYYLYKESPIINFILEETAQEKKKAMWLMMIVMIFWICVTGTHIVFTVLPGTQCYSVSLMNIISMGVLLYIVTTYLILFLTEMILFLKVSNNREKLSLATQQEQDIPYPNEHIARNALNKSKDHRTLVDLVAIGYRIKDMKVHQRSVQLNLCPANVTMLLKSKGYIRLDKTIGKVQLMEAAEEIQSLSTHTIRPIFSQKFLREPDDNGLGDKKNQLYCRNVDKYIRIWVSILVLAIIFMLVLNTFGIKDYGKEPKDMIDMLQMIQENKKSILDDHKYELNWNNWCYIWYQSYILVINLVILLSILTIFSISIRKLISV